MAEDDNSGQAGDISAVDGNGEDNTPQIALISQYIKDLSFENPNAPQVFQWQGQPQVDVQLNLNAANVADDLQEVVIKIEVQAKSQQRTAFQVEVAYAGLFGMRNVPADQVQPFLLTEAPRLLFPFARRVVAEAVRDGGFPPLMLDPIDFHALYQDRMERDAGPAAGEDTAGQA